ASRRSGACTASASSGRRIGTSAGIAERAREIAPVTDGVVPASGADAIPSATGHWQPQSYPHAPVLGMPTHAMPGGQVPYLQKLQVAPPRLGPQGITA